MKKLKARLLEISKVQNIAFSIIEQDYVLSWVLSGIASHPILSEILVFKGGTALKKCYFGNYRFSQDLDWTVVKPIEDSQLDEYISESCAIAEEQLRRYEKGCSFRYKAYRESKPHPLGQRAYSVHASLPWHRQPMVTVLIEITKDELVINPAEVRPILHTYGEPLDTRVQVYCLEEITMEKLRAILQQIIKMHERSWGRSRARDYYDIWMIFNKYQPSLDLEKIRTNVEKKFSIKRIHFKSIDDFFDKKYIDETIRTWDHWLKPYVRDLPSPEVVLDDVKTRILPKIFL